MIQNMIFFKDVKYFADCCTYEWIATIGSTMVSRLQRSLSYFFPKDKSTYRHTTSKSLGTGHNIWFHTISLPCKVASCTSHTALYFIKDQDDIFLITDCAKSFQKFFLCRVNTTFALHYFCNDSAGLVCDLGFDTFQIIKICKSHTTDQWFKGFSVMFGSCYRKRPHTSSMERMIHGNNLIFLCFFAIFLVSIFTGNFQCSLNGFCTTVCKKCFAETAGFYQFVSCFAHRFIII